MGILIGFSTTFNFGILIQMKLTKWLKGPESAKGVVGQMVIEFNDDESVLEEMSEDNCNFLALNNLDILMAGVLRFFHIQVGVIAHTFILTSEDGIPGKDK